MTEKRFRRTKAEIKQGLTIEQAKANRVLQQKSTLTDFVEDTITKKLSEKKQRRFQRKHWFFTLNNYTLEDVEMFKDFITSQCSVGAFQSEMGGTRKTPHLQGFFVTFEKRRFTSFKLTERTHWELMRGSLDQNISYCLKEDSFDSESNIRFLHNCDMPKESKAKHLLSRKPEVLKDGDLFEWQRRVCNIAQTIPDDRIIYWKYDSGNTGKSQLVSKLVSEYEALLVDGSKTNIAYNVVDYHNKRGYYPPTIVVDIPRAQSHKWSSENDGMQSFAGIESVKNGLFASTKYEAQMIHMPVPHIFIFSNAEPNNQLFTLDRWRIEKIVLSEEEQQRLLQKKAEVRKGVDQHLNLQLPEPIEPNDGTNGPTNWGPIDP